MKAVIETSATIPVPFQRPQKSPGGGSATFGGNVKAAIESLLRYGKYCRSWYCHKNVASAQVSERPTTWKRKGDRKG
jgi:hypothetical protein